jgi:hypothetical protein
MLLGKAHAQAGQNAVALGEMQKGLRILEQSAGSHNPKYLAAEIAYSRVLDQSGAHTAARQSVERRCRAGIREAEFRCLFRLLNQRPSLH